SEPLTALPTSWSATLLGIRVAVHHASPRSDMDGIYPDSARGSDVRRWLDQARPTSCSLAILTSWCSSSPPEGGPPCLSFLDLLWNGPCIVNGAHVMIHGNPPPIRQSPLRGRFRPYRH